MAIPVRRPYYSGRAGIATPSFDFSRLTRRVWNLGVREVPEGQETCLFCITRWSRRRGNPSDHRYIPPQACHPLPRSGGCSTLSRWPLYSYRPGLRICYLPSLPPVTIWSGSEDSVADFQAIPDLATTMPFQIERMARLRSLTHGARRRLVRRHFSGKQSRYFYHNRIGILEV
jgi:hypothetical protein